MRLCSSRYGYIWQTCTLSLHEVSDLIFSAQGVGGVLTGMIEGFWGV